MKTPLGLLNLWHQRTRTLVSTSGVAFALLLVFAQLGFMGAVSHTATNTFRHLKFDLLVRSSNYAHFFEPSQVDRRLLTVAQNTAGVADVAPLWITVLNWQRIVPGRVPSQAPDVQPIGVMAFDTSDEAFDLPDLSRLVQAGSLRGDNNLLIDQMTRPEFEPINGRQFGPNDIGTEAEILGSRFRIAGVYRLGTGLAANGSMITSDRGYARLLPVNTKTTAALGLVQLESGQSADQVLKRLLDRFQLQAIRDPTWPPQWSVSVLTRQQAIDWERQRWLWQTPIGLIFQLGVVISLIVGSAIVYMVLATDVTERLPEYATLLAIGYSRGYLASIVMTQAVLLAFCGFVVAWLLAETLYRFATAYSGITMSMDWQRIALVCVLGLGMCCFSGLLALRKLWKAEPANLF
jgi:putative ABC transport system permease protein